MFDTDILISQKIKRVKSNVFRLTYLDSVPMAIGTGVLLFPNFQRTFWPLLPLFFKECKGKGRFITTKIFYELFQSFWNDFQIVLWRTKLIFLSGSKNTLYHFPHKFFKLLFLHICHTFVFTKSENYFHFLKTGQQR